MQPVVLHTEEMAFHSSLADLDLRRLQLAFSDLFDRASEAIQRLGLDQDDIVLDRFLICRTPEGPHDIPAEWISDKARLIQSVQAHLRSFAKGSPQAPVPPLAAEILGLKVVVRAEPFPTREFPVP